MKCLIVGCICFLTGITAGIIYIIYRAGYLVEKSQIEAEKYKTYFQMLNQLYAIRNGEKPWKNLQSYGTVGIYGKGILGSRLMEILEMNDVQVKFVMDQSDVAFYSNKPVYRATDQLPLVDAVIVTPAFEFEKIRGTILQGNPGANVVNITELLQKQ